MTHELVGEAQLGVENVVLAHQDEVVEPPAGAESELGLGSGGRLDNFILVGEDEVINTELRFPDEFVRHKILDIIGDLYLVGYPIRGKVTARLTGHRDNIALIRQIVAG